MAEDREERRKKELLDAVRQARAEFESLQDEVDGAKDGYYDAVRSLNEAGMPLREIAEHLGLSHQRVHQMLTAEPRRQRGKNVARGLGAAGVVLAIVLSTVSLLQDPPPAPPVEKREVTLVQEPIITRNDIKEVHRYEEAIASGRAGGKRWRFLVSHLGGIFCSRFVWSPGPRLQGETCGPIEGQPDRVLDSDDLGFTINPVLPNDPINPVPVAHGHINFRWIREVIVETCDGERIKARVFHEPVLSLSFFAAFLPRGTERAHIEAVDLDGEATLLTTRNFCR